MRRIMDHIVDNGYVLIDIDGTHTRWGVWAPERLNHDPDWATERGINSVEILSYLKATAHITGDEKYEREYRRLLFEEHYAHNVRQAKTYIPGWRTHIDDELLALAYPALLAYENRPADPGLVPRKRRRLVPWRRQRGQPILQLHLRHAYPRQPKPGRLAHVSARHAARSCQLDVSTTRGAKTSNSFAIPILDDIQTSRLVAAKRARRCAVG